MKKNTGFKENCNKVILAMPYFVAILAVLFLLYLGFRFLPKGEKFLSLIFGSGLTGAAAILGIFYKQASKEKAQIENAPDEGLSKLRKEIIPTKEKIEEEFLKLEIGDLQDITDESNKSHRENNILIYSYSKNPLLQLRLEQINEDFDESWIPSVTADMGGREKNPYWRLVPVYQNNTLPFFYYFIQMDGFRYWVPLPYVEYNKIEKFEINKNKPVKRCTVTKVQYNLGKVLTNDHGNYNDSYDDILKQCKIEIVR